MGGSWVPNLKPHAWPTQHTSKPSIGTTACEVSSARGRVISPVVAVGVYKSTTKYGLLKTLKEQRGVRPDTAFRCELLFQVAVLCV